MFNSILPSMDMLEEQIQLLTPDSYTATCGGLNIDLIYQSDTDKHFTYMMPHHTYI